MTSDGHNDAFPAPQSGEGNPLANIYTGDPGSLERLAAAEFITRAVEHAADVTALIETDNANGNYWNGWFATKEPLPENVQTDTSARRVAPEPASRVPKRDLLYMRGLARAAGLSQNPETKAWIERDLRKAIDHTFGAEGAA